MNVTPLPANAQLPLTQVERPQDRVYSFEEFVEALSHPASGITPGRAQYWATRACPILVPSVERPRGVGRGPASGRRIYDEQDVTRGRILGAVLLAGGRVSHLRQLRAEFLDISPCPLLDPALAPGQGYNLWFARPARPRQSPRTGWTVTIVRTATGFDAYGFARTLIGATDTAADDFVFFSECFGVARMTVEVGELELQHPRFARAIERRRKKGVKIVITKGSGFSLKREEAVEAGTSTARYETPEEAPRRKNPPKGTTSARRFPLRSLAKAATVKTGNKRQRRTGGTTLAADAPPP